MRLMKLPSWLCSVRFNVSSMLAVYYLSQMEELLSMSDYFYLLIAIRD